jgi:hypothetical protein
LANSRERSAAAIMSCPPSPAEHDLSACLLAPIPVLARGKRTLDDVPRSSASRNWLRRIGRHAKVKLKIVETAFFRLRRRS